MKRQATQIHSRSLLRHLEVELVPSVGDNRALNTAHGRNTRGVRDAADSPSRRSVGNTTEIVTSSSGESTVGRVQRLLGVLEDIVLHKQLRALASVDTVANVVVVVVEDVAGTEAERRAAGVDVLEAVAVVGHGEMAGVFAAVVVGVADERALVVVVQVRVRNGDPVASVGDVEEAVVVVLRVGHVGGKVDVVN